MPVSAPPSPPPDPPPSVLSVLPQMARLPHAWGVTGAVLMLGLATSLAGPYMSLFAVQWVGMSPLQLGIFLTLNALSAVGVSTVLSRRSERADRKPLVLLTLAAGVLAYLALSAVHSVWSVWLTGVLLLSLSAAAFPQVFALARAGFAGAPGDLPERAVTLLRSVFSFAWVVGPGVGAAVLSLWSYRGVFLFAALCYALAALPLLRVRSPGPPPAPATSAVVAALTAPPPPRTLGGAFAAFVLYGMAMQMGMAMFPLFVTETLSGSKGQVGFLIGLCALLEIPVMLLFVLKRRLPRLDTLIKLGLGLFGVHFLLIYFAQGLPALIAAQALRAVVLAILAGLGMAYFQQLMPGRFSAATTTFSNSSILGGMLSGITAGIWAQAFGYRPVFLLCALLSVAALGLMLWVTRRGSAEGAAGA